MEPDNLPIDVGINELSEICGLISARDDSKR